MGFYRISCDEKLCTDETYSFIHPGLYRRPLFNSRFSVTLRILMSQDANPQPDHMVLDAQPSDTSEAVHAHQSRTSRSDDHVIRARDQRPVEGGHSERSFPDPHAYAEAIANETMQDVFDDVDRLLNKGAIVPAKSLDDSLADDGDRGFSATPLSTGGALAPIERPDTADAPLIIPDPPVEDESPVISPAASPERFKAFLVKFSLMVTASVALGIGLAFWIAQRNRTELVAIPPSGTAPVSSASATEASPFSEYLGEALATIDRQYELQAIAEDIPPPPPPSSATGGDISNPPPAVERVYIPVYQPPQNPNAPPSIAAAPFSQIPAEASASANNSSAPIQNIAPNTTHTLVGVLELGDRSAAIFQYAGSAHRVEIGAQIGSSGWSLVSVSGQEAIIRRNGDVRSIYLEQSF